MELTERQRRIVEIVRDNGPITGEHIADQLMLTRATLRPDLTILSMSGVLEARPRVGYSYREKRKQSPLAERMALLRVGDFKSVAAVVRDTASIYDAIVSLFTHNVGSLSIVNTDNMLTGIVSRKDLLKATLGKTDLHEVPVSVIMTRMPNIIVTRPDETVLEAVTKLVRHQVDALPVVEGFVDESGNEVFEVVGRFTKTIVAKLFAEIADPNF